MSNVLQFPNKEYQRELKRKQLAEQIERTRAQGGQAIESLTSWRRSIPMADRERLARNMDAILVEYRIVTSSLGWQQDYVTVEEFRRDLHRMHLPETASPGRKLIASPAKWTRLLGYIARYLQANGESVSLEFLADRLIGGTRFHPTKKKLTGDEKLLYLLGLWGNDLSKKFGLLETYRKIARARAEYYRIHRCAIGSFSKDPESEPAALESKLSDEFTIPSDDAVELFEKKFVEYTESDWNALYVWIPDMYHRDYKFIQEEVTDWKNTYSEDGALHYAGDGAPLLCWGNDIPFLPHWFVGYIDGDRKNVMTSQSDDWLAEILRQQGTQDPILLHQEIDWNLAGAYLVLYPDSGMNRIVPWLYYLCEEGSAFDPVDRSYGLGEIKYFRPKGVNETTISHTLLRRVEESMDEVLHSWETTSRELESHPYVVWMKQRETNIDKAIDAVLKRTVHTGADDKQS